MPNRVKTWEKLADEWKIPMIETVVEELTLNDLDQAIDRMLQSKHKGRVIINMTA
jgi:D-arabinose 1-dehydrogenase-like Zn-dependent alcohol dehydrogenase